MNVHQGTRNHEYPRAVHFAVLSCAFLPAWACAGGERTGDTAVGSAVRDSAGVRIVESIAPSWTDQTAWRLGPDPGVDIGAVQGDPDYELFQVTGAVRLSDGRLAVANGDQEIRMYGPDGVYETTLSRRGEGPGEFTGLWGLHLMPADSLLALDLLLRRLSVFAPTGEFARSFTLAEPPGAEGSSLVARFADGSLLVRGWNAPDEVPNGYMRDTIPFFRYSGTGEYAADLGRHVGDEHYWVQREIGGRVGISNRLPIYGRTGHFATAGARYLTAQTDRYEYRLYDPSGDLERVVRRLVEPVPVTDALVDAAIEQYVTGIDDDNRRRDRLNTLRELPVAETLPAFGRHAWARRSFNLPSVIVDDGQNVWVHEYVLPREPEVRWSVFDSSGVWLGTVEVPERFEPLQIGSDFVLGIWVDDLEVEHVQLYVLVKASTS